MSDRARERDTHTHHLYAWRSGTITVKHKCSGKKPLAAPIARAWHHGDMHLTAKLQIGCPAAVSQVRLEVRLDCLEQACHTLHSLSTSVRTIPENQALILNFPQQSALSHRLLREESSKRRSVTSSCHITSEGTTPVNRFALLSPVSLRCSRSTFGSLLSHSSHFRLPLAPLSCHPRALLVCLPSNLLF